VHSGSFSGSRRAAYLLLRYYGRGVFTNQAGGKGGLIDSYIYASIGLVKEVMLRYAFLGLDWPGLGFSCCFFFFFLDSPVSVLATLCGVRCMLVELIAMVDTFSHTGLVYLL